MSYNVGNGNFVTSLTNARYEPQGRDEELGIRACCGAICHKEAQTAFLPAYEKSSYDGRYDNAAQSRGSVRTQWKHIQSTTAWSPSTMRKKPDIAWMRG